MSHKILLLLITLVAVLLAGGLTLGLAQAGRAVNSTPIPDWEQANQSGFGMTTTMGVSSLEVFQNSLYAGTSNYAIGVQVWHSSDGMTWEPASQPNFGVTNTLLTSIPDLMEFNNQLYAGTSWGGNPGQIWRSPDGTTWEPVTQDGFGDPDNTGFTTFFEHSGDLYAASTNLVNGFQLWRSGSGDPLDWSNVITAGLGYTTNVAVTGFMLYKDNLYLAIEQPSPATPAQVWNSADGAHWNPVSIGFGDPNNYATGGFTIFQDALYLGTRNDVTGGQLWSTTNGTEWSKIIGDGFSDVNNVKFESLSVFENALIVGTYNQVTGLEVARSYDGVHFHQMNVNGFGNVDNHSTLWDNATTPFGGRLYMGTWNAVDGGEIWRYTPATLTGTVTNANTLEPVQGAEIYVAADYATLSGPNGDYVLPLEVGVFTVTVSATDYISQTATNVELISGTVTLDFALEPIPPSAIVYLPVILR